MAQYVDGYVIPIKKTKIAAYKKMAQMGCKIWMKHGALSYYECVMDDFKMMGNNNGFKKMGKLKSGETAVFAFVVYKSKAHRDSVNKKVHQEMAAMEMPSGFEMPFDMKRFAVAGCKVLVNKTKR